MDKRAPLASVVVALGVVFVWLLCSPFGANDLVGGDEGFYGTTARNMLADPHYVLSPSFHPLGVPGDKPPLYAAGLALSVRALGASEAAVRWPSLLFAVCIALGVGRLARRAGGEWAGLAAASALVTLSWFAASSRQVAAEIPLTALGTLALVAVPSGPLTVRRARLAGLLLGLGFLCKLWLIGLVATPLLAASWPARRDQVRPLLVIVLTAVLVASLHLLSLAAWAPALLPHWWRVYLGASLADRVAGGGYAGYWLHPAGYYWGTLTHAFGLLLPLVLCGVVDACRRIREPWPRALLVWAGTVFVISAFAVKSGGYAYVVVPAWAALAGLGAAALAAGRRPHPAAIAAGILVTAPPLVVWAGGVPLESGVWVAVWAAFALVWVVLRVRPAMSARAAAWFTLAVVALGFARETRRLSVPYHALGYRAVAAAVAPRLRDVPAGRPCFVAPEAPAFEYYLFRTGQYWSSPYVPWTPARRGQLQRDTTLRVFVLDTEQKWYGSELDSSMVRWLEGSTRELPRPTDARLAWGPTLRVFVRP